MILKIDQNSTHQTISIVDYIEWLENVSYYDCDKKILYPSSAMEWWRELDIIEHVDRVLNNMKFRGVIVRFFEQHNLPLEGVEFWVMRNESPKTAKGMYQMLDTYYRSGYDMTNGTRKDGWWEK